MMLRADQDMWVTITDAISMELIGHIRLNWFSPSGLLLKWGINPSHSLKCMMTDSGKMTACWFVCIFAPYLPAKFTLWESAYQKGLMSHLLWLLTQQCFTKSQTMFNQETVFERWSRAAERMLWNYSTWSRKRLFDFGNSAGRAILQLNYRHIFTFDI